LKRATNIENEIAPAADFAGIPPLLPAKSSGHFKIEIPLVYFLCNLDIPSLKHCKKK
jgi:hypothetical protein